MMTTLGWALLEHLIRVGVWAHAAQGPTGPVGLISPLAALVALAVVCALTVVIADAARGLVRALFARAARGPRPFAGPRRAQWRAPSRMLDRRGAQGPRAPGALLVG